MTQMRVGVLALQGCVQPHRPHIESLGGQFIEVRRTQDLESLHGLILPGGESTTMLKLIDIFSLNEPLEKAFQRIPIWGICAGAILMAKTVLSPQQKSFGLLDMTVERNSYGRQLDSFNTQISDFPVSFIRAPGITSYGSGVRVRAEHDGKPIWVESGKFMATTFHPELSQEFPSPMHQAFFKMMSL